ncbi:MAG TPA: hypothetical protein V6D12_20885, partial [Candidatus Obscuribacterales bacterium]
DSDKREIINLYRQSPETTSTLANRYGVSSSTISRFLKTSLPEYEYEALIQQKRITRTPFGGAEAIAEAVDQPLESDTQTLLPSVNSIRIGGSEAVAEAVDQPLESDTQALLPSVNSRRLRRRSSITSNPAAIDNETTEFPQRFVDKPAEPEQMSFDFAQEPEEQEEPEIRDFDELLAKDADVVEASSLKEMLAEGANPAEVSALEEMLGEDISDDDDDDDDDLDDSDDDDWEDDIADVPSHGPVERFFRDRGANVQVLPLSEASLPKTCYLVVDRAAELIARPLKDFSDLGKIPATEVQQKTLPVFDNHRVARRFSNRTQRVIKIPDGRMLQKACSHLQAKGITRLLIDGQVYSLLQ